MAPTKTYKHLLILAFPLFRINLLLKYKKLTDYNVTQNVKMYDKMKNVTRNVQITLNLRATNVIENKLTFE